MSKAKAPKATGDANARLRRMPRMDEMQALPELQALVARHSRAEAMHYLSLVMGELREALKKGDADLPEGGEAAAVLETLSRKLDWHARRRKRRVVNGTGIILHTGLGRAFLGPEARRAVADCAGYANVEVDVHSGERNIREEYLADLLCILTGAEAATVVNNCAAATLLIINTFAWNKETVVSRGELVEIGGSFRVPDVMKRANSILREVGTTNKTRLKDYEQAIGPATGLLMKIHTSNFRIQGFTESVSNEDLAKLGWKHELPVVEDLGSGAIIDPAGYGMAGEPLVLDSLKSGLDAICFSGDKLLGGPQAGIILGKKKAVSQIRANPLFRALRVDKLTLAALEATVRVYVQGLDAAKAGVPTWRMMGESLDVLRLRADKLADRITLTKSDCRAEAVESTTQPGSGALPAREIATWAVAVTSGRHSAKQIGAALRRHATPIFTRIQDETVFLDLRTIQPEDEAEIVAAFEGFSSLVRDRKA